MQMPVELAFFPGCSCVFRGMPAPNPFPQGKDRRLGSPAEGELAFRQQALGRHGLRSSRSQMPQLCVPLRSLREELWSVFISTFPLPTSNFSLPPTLPLRSWRPGASITVSLPPPHHAFPPTSDRPQSRNSQCSPATPPSSLNRPNRI